MHMRRIHLFCRHAHSNNHKKRLIYDNVVKGKITKPLPSFSYLLQQYNNLNLDEST
jgi:hypothetical protein